jgi:hypothetical protein
MAQLKPFHIVPEWKKGLGVRTNRDVHFLRIDVRLFPSWTPRCNILSSSRLLLMLRYKHILNHVRKASSWINGPSHRTINIVDNPLFPPLANVSPLQFCYIRPTTTPQTWAYQQQTWHAKASGGCPHKGWPYALHAAERIWKRKPVQGRLVMEWAI